MPVLLYRIKAQKKLFQAEVQQLETIQAKVLKRIFNQPIARPYMGLISEVGVCPGEKNNKLQLIDDESEYYKQQQVQIGQTNNSRTKSSKPPKHLPRVSEQNSRRIKYEIRSSSNNGEIRVEKKNKRLVSE